MTGGRPSSHVFLDVEDNNLEELNLQTPSDTLHTIYVKTA